MVGSIPPTTNLYSSRGIPLVNSITPTSFPNLSLHIPTSSFVMDLDPGQPARARTFIPSSPRYMIPTFNMRIYNLGNKLWVSTIVSSQVRGRYVFSSTYPPWNGFMFRGTPFSTCLFSFRGASLPRGTNPIRMTMPMGSNAYGGDFA